MIFTSTQLPGAIVVDVQRLEDTRGWFERTYCEREFKAYGLPTGMVQASMSLTRRAGTLRGMHYQLAPHAEDKLVRCVRGGIPMARRRACVLTSFERIGLDADTFAARPFTRLKQLRYLISSGQLDDNLFWNY